MITKYGTLYTDTQVTHHVDWLKFFQGDNTESKDLLSLQQLVERAYGIPSVELCGANSDEKLVFTVKKERLEEYDQAVIANMVSSGTLESHHLIIIMIDLCNKDVIEPGYYSIFVGW